MRAAQDDPVADIPGGAMWLIMPSLTVDARGRQIALRQSGRRSSATLLSEKGKYYPAWYKTDQSSVPGAKQRITISLPIRVHQTMA
jgi:hypothetical protein